MEQMDLWCMMQMVREKYIVLFSLNKSLLYPQISVKAWLNPINANCNFRQVM